MVHISEHHFGSPGRYPTLEVDHRSQCRKGPTGLTAYRTPGGVQLQRRPRSMIIPKRAPLVFSSRLRTQERKNPRRRVYRLRRLCWPSFFENPKCGVGSAVGDGMAERGKR